MNRIEKIDPDTLSGETRRIFDRWSPGGKPLNIVLIYFRNAELNRNWSYMATHLFMKNSLSDRHREIVVLRTSWQCASDYEFIQHVRIAREGNLLSDDEIAALTKPDALATWPVEEQALAAAADELLAWNCIGDGTWSELERHFAENQLMDIVATAGGYTLNSMATSSFGVDIEDSMTREEGLVPSWNSPAFRFLERSGDVALPRGPRIAPLAREKMDSAVLERIESWLDTGRRSDLFQTLAKYPNLVRGWSSMIQYVDSTNTLSDYDRLAVALRTAFRCRSEAELAERSQAARSAGFPSEDLAALIENPPGAYEDCGRDLLARAVDELIDKMIIGEEHWQTLGAHYRDEQIMDIVFATATQLMICWMQNAFGIAFEGRR